MFLLIVTSVLVFINHVHAYCPETTNACLDTTHMKLDSNDDLTRSMKYFDLNAAYFGDFAILEGWYRATTGVGGDMPTEAPTIGHCQALYPVWFNETFPTLADGAVERKACVKTFLGDCSETLDICIKKCNLYNEVYNVYWLSRPTNANARYCFGNRLKCTDKPGFEPCLDPVPEPIFNSSVVRVPNGMQCYFLNYFYCYIQHSNHSLFFDVIWSADGKVIKTIEDQAYTEDAFELSPQDLRDGNIPSYGINIRCTVKSKSEAMGLADTGNYSEIYVGFETGTTFISLEEGGATENFKVTTTVPLECWDLCFRPDTAINCKLIFEIVRPQDSNTGTCLTVTDDVVFETAVTSDPNPQTCVVTLGHNPFGSNPLELNIPIKARLDDLYDGNKEFALQLQTREDPLTQTLWANMKLPRVQISVTDKDATISGKYCYFYDDPHARSFNGRYYEMQLAGVFILYRQITGIPIEVQALFQNRGRYSTSCGVAVRSYGELYVINLCGRSFHTKFYECDKLNVGGAAITNLQISYSGGRYTIKLPTGGRVVFTTGYRTITIYPGLSDYKNTEGLCGFLKENAINDLVARNGGSFSQSWRVNENVENSLFTGQINDQRKNKDTVFCGCEGQQATGDLKSVCTAEGTSLTTCVEEGNDETDKYMRFCGLSKRSSEKTDDLDDSVPYNPNNYYDVNYVAPTPVWTNGWTEQSATAHCENFYNRKSITMCQDVAGVNVTQTVLSCVLDIQITGSTEYSIVGVDNIVSQCVKEIQKNVTLLTTNTTSSTGTTLSIAEELLLSLCPSDCNDHGQCINGACQCDNDYIGLSCSDNKRHVPQIEPIPFNAMCDMFTRPCQMSIVYGDLFIESENLTCHVKVLNIDGASRSQSLTQNATFEHYQKVFCPLPTSQLPYILNVSVSNDKVSYSEDTQLLVYDSTCWNCSFTSGCTKQAMSCIVTGSCYAKDMVNPTNSKETCQPSKDEYGWTAVEETTSTVSTPSTKSTASTKTSQQVTTTNMMATQSTKVTTPMPATTVDGAKETTTTPPTTVAGAKETTTTPPTTVHGTKETTTTPPTTVAGAKETATTPATTVAGVKETTTTQPTTVAGAEETTTSQPTTVTGAKETTTTPQTTVVGVKETTTATPPTTVAVAKETTTIPPTTVAGAKETTTAPPTTVAGAKETTTIPPTTVAVAKETTTIPPTIVPGAKETATTPATTETTNYEQGSANEQNGSTGQGTNAALYIGIGFGGFVLLIIAGGVVAWLYIKNRGGNVPSKTLSSTPSSDNQERAASNVEPDNSTKSYKRSQASLGDIEADTALGPVGPAWTGNAPMSHALKPDYFQKPQGPSQPQLNSSQGVSPFNGSEIGKSYNFREMRPRSGQRPNTQIDPLPKPTQPTVDPVYQFGDE